MSRYRGPKLRITRRLGTLPGLTKKKSNKKYKPGKGEIDSKKTTQERSSRLETSDQKREKRTRHDALREPFKIV